jgi:hypothetical protein
MQRLQLFTSSNKDHHAYIELSNCRQADKTSWKPDTDSYENLREAEKRAYEQLTVDNDNLYET